MAEVLEISYYQKRRRITQYLHGSVELLRFQTDASRVTQGVLAIHNALEEYKLNLLHILPECGSRPCAAGRFLQARNDGYLNSARYGLMLLIRAKNPDYMHERILPALKLAGAEVTQLFPASGANAHTMGIMLDCAMYDAYAQREKSAWEEGDEAVARRSAGMMFLYNMIYRNHDVAKIREGYNRFAAQFIATNNFDVPVSPSYRASPRLGTPGELVAFNHA